MHSFFEDIKSFRIILGSQSPRRKQLLEWLGLNFEVCVRPSDERIPSGISCEQAAGYVAAAKMKLYDDLRHHPNLIITADTIVCLQQEIIGKPSDELQAYEMLRKLSGRMHEVFTGVCIAAHNRMDSFVVRSEVWFRDLSDDEIRYYIRTYKPFDKAGSYGVQDWMGLTGIDKISGSFYNVMGLPVKEVYESLKFFCMELRK